MLLDFGVRQLTLRRTFRQSVLFLLIISGSYFLSLVFFRHAQAIPNTDFTVFHAVAHAVLTGAIEPAELYDPAALQSHMDTLYGYSRNLWWLYPPPLMVLLSPLGLLPLNIAYLAWAVGVMACIGLAAWLFGARELLWLGLTINPTTALVMAYGQIDALALLALSFLLVTRPLWAGLAACILCLKPQFIPIAGLLLVFVRRDTIAYFALWGAGIAAITTMLLGVEVWSASVDGLQAFVNRIEGAQRNWTALISPYALLRGSGIRDATSMLIHIIIAIIAIGLAAFSLVEIPRDRSIPSAIALGLLTPHYLSWTAIVLLLSPLSKPTTSNLQVFLLLIYGILPVAISLTQLQAPSWIVPGPFIIIACSLLPHFVKRQIDLEKTA